MENARLIRRAFYLASVFVSLGISSLPGLAADSDVCAKGTGGDVIAACTRVIAAAGRAKGSNLSWAYVNRGNAYEEKGEFDRAIRDQDEAIRLDAKSFRAYLGRAAAYHDKRDYDRAVRDYDQAVRLDPKSAHAYFGRGTAFREKRDYDRAIREYDDTLGLDPVYTAELTSRGLSRAGKGDNDGARADFNAALALPQKHENGKWAHDMARAALAGSNIVPNIVTTVPIRSPTNA